MIHSVLGTKMLKAERSSLESSIIVFLSKWRLHGDRGDFKRAMHSLDEFVALTP